MATATVVNVVPTDIGSMLAGLSAPADPKGKKSKVPVVAGYGPGVDELVRRKHAFKQAETELAMAETEFLPTARRLYEERARQGNFSKSLNFAGEKTAGARVAFSDRFTAMPVEAKPALVEALGERYDVLFDEARALTLRKTDDDSIRFLLQRLGPDVFQEFFEVKVAIKPKDGFDQRQFELPESVRGLVTQFKPSVTAL
jgi:hypothetical protein